MGRGTGTCTDEHELWHFPPKTLRTRGASEECGSGVHRDGGGQLDNVFCFSCLYGIDG